MEMVFGGRPFHGVAHALIYLLCFGCVASIPISIVESRSNKPLIGIDQSATQESMYFSALQLNSSAVKVDVEQKSTRKSFLQLGKIVLEHYGTRISHGSKDLLMSLRNSEEKLLARRRSEGIDNGKECYRWSYMFQEGQSGPKLGDREGVRAWSDTDSIYVAGGCPLGGDVEMCFDDVWKFNTLTRMWSQIRLVNTPTPSISVLKVKNPAWVYESMSKTMYTYGGLTATGYSRYLSIIYYSETDKEKASNSVIPYRFQQLHCSGDHPEGLEGASLTLVKLLSDRLKPILMLFGGYSDNGFSNEVYTVPAQGPRSKCSWEKIITTNKKPAARFGHAVASSGSKMYVFGGTDFSTIFSDLHVLSHSPASSKNPSSWNWMELTALPTSSGVSFASLTIVDSLSVRGTNRSTVKSNSTIKSNSKKSSGTSTEDLKLLLFGGCRGFKCYDNLTIYSINTNAWKQSPASLTKSYEGVTLAPEPRGKAAFVWFTKNSSDPSPSQTLSIVGGCSSNQCFGNRISVLDLSGICSNQSCGAGTYRNASKAHILQTGELGKCECDIGFTGKNCDTKGPEYCPNKCSGNGHCNYRCICKPGFQGDDCSQRSCPNDCTSSDQGTCDPINGICRCTGGFWGPDCSFQNCPNNCTSHGLCALKKFLPLAKQQETVCACQDRYQGSDCSVIPVDSGNPDKALDSKTGKPLTPRKISGFCHLHCSGHGICQRDSVLLSSVKQRRETDLDHLIDEAVQNPSATFAAEALLSSGSESMRSDEIIETAPYCACERGFGGEFCQKECPLLCSDRGLCQSDGKCLCDKGFTGQGCEETYCIDNCSDRGRCEGGTCVCEEGFIGKYCQLDTSCNNHGSLNANKTACRCDVGYGGFDCSLRISCKNACSAHGTCKVAGTAMSSVDFASAKHVSGSEPKLEGICACDPGFTGVDCSKKSCPKDCSGGGHCDSNTGKCSCYSGFFGEDCSKLVNCPGNCTGTHGMCMEDGNCKCNEGWTGGQCEHIGCPNDCSNHGTCSEGLCRCDDGYFGTACNVTCPGGCLNGKCYNGKCICDLFHYGERCGIPYECPTTTGLACSGNGICDRTNGNCTCHPGYEGKACERGRKCPGNCNGRGECVLGQCQCDPQWTGPSCLDRPSCAGNCSLNGVCLNSGSCSCFSGFSGNDCSQFSSDNTCENHCHDKGICYKGRCYCVPGHSGKNCEITEKCDAGRNCSSHGTCQYGRCFCDPGWQGKDCSEPEVCATGCIKGQGKCVNQKCHCLPGFKGSDCSEAWECPRNCSGRGVCINGRCACLPAYAGSGCELESIATDISGAVKPVVPGTCPNKCNGHGYCLHGQCHCVKGYLGLSCEIKASSPCDSKCNHGVCEYGKCFCYPGWEGPNCDLQIPCPYNCTQNGICSLGKCFCVAGWTGADCSERTTAEERRQVLEEAMLPNQPKCPNACSGYGLCVSGRCYCDTGRGGPSCSYIDGGPLVHRCPNNCSSKGDCFFGKCYCHPPNFGRACELQQSLSCPSDCNGHGICSFGKCICDPGFTGVSCSVTKKCDPPCDMGMCVNGECRCIKDYTGKTCSMHPGGVYGESLQTVAFRATKHSSESPLPSSDDNHHHRDRDAGHNRLKGKHGAGVGIGRTANGHVLPYETQKPYLPILVFILGSTACLGVCGCVFWRMWKRHTYGAHQLGKL